MGKLTTHVLDTANGIPAARMRYALYRVSGDRRDRLAEGATNGDGRAPAPLLEGAAVHPGVYELEFDAAGYFRDRGTALPEPPFAGVVVLRFGIADAHGHYHVPLLVSPWSWSTYRGS
jgi:5-hydroxyisourate hydrolase